MENKYDNRDFEQFVKQNADQYRMFPSEKVWEHIHHTLHHRNRWYGFGLALLVLTTFTVTWVMLSPSNNKQQLATRLPEISQAIQIADDDVTDRVYIAPAQKPESKDPSTASFRNYFMTDISDQPVLNTGMAEELAPAAISRSYPHENFATEIPATILQVPRFNVPANTIAYQKTEPAIQLTPQPVMPAMAFDELEPVLESPSPENKQIADIQKKAELPLTIESVTNSYIQVKKKNKFSMQAYFTPTISYRRLKEENKFISETQARTVTASNATVTIADVNSVVTHKPDFGLQLGVNTGYELSPRLTLVSGLQFNVSKYDIRAYNYPSEPARIALMYYSSVETEATYRNYSGSQNPDWLHNLYFSASLPIGLQVRVSGAGKPDIGITGTVQPTYVLGNRTYLLTTDYKNYVEAPSLVRRWNVSTSLEAFAGISRGKIEWRIGPLVRYQLFSSFKQTYPVKEHLFDFGLKVGVMLNK